jgi:hypothetical protein
MKTVNSYCTSSIKGEALPNSMSTADRDLTWFGFGKGDCPGASAGTLRHKNYT